MRANQLNHEPESILGSSLNGPAAVAPWVTAIVIIGGFLMMLGGLIALVRPSMLLAPGEVISSGVHIYAGYFAARSLALGLFLPLMLAFRARRTLVSLMVLVGSIQILDVIMDCIEGRWTIVPGVLLLGIAYLIGAARVSGTPFWRRDSWS